ncbi:MAG: class I SAM-dependent methyltransferase [Solirubrobacterales bacterium]
MKSSDADRESPYAFSANGPLAGAIEVAGRFADGARDRRYERFLRTIRPKPDERLVDIGCGSSWSLAELDPTARVTGVDLAYRGGFGAAHQAFVAADACDLPFATDSFDIAYSNSLVEHIGADRRRRFADELRRVAGRYWVQTPNRWFPIEPHALLPGVQLLPVGLRRRAWKLSPRQIPYENSLELLNRDELADLFDDGLILEERVGPLTKSLIAVGPQTAFRRH